MTAHTAPASARGLTVETPVRPHPGHLVTVRCSCDTHYRADESDPALIASRHFRDGDPARAEWVDGWLSHPHGYTVTTHDGTRASIYAAPVNR